MKLAEYVRLDAVGLKELLDGGELAPDELRETALRAIEAVEPRINALVGAPFTDTGSANPDGPLGGIPFAVKDTLFVRGRPVAFGSRLGAGLVAPVSATLAERFAASGLVTLGRTACPEFAFNFDTSPVTNGPTLNPWDTGRSPGGSSGGSAALVAARAVPFAHGNDGAGSIRVPAAWCGLVGLKPTRGRVPIGPVVGEAIGGLAHEFALTRSVRDTALLLDTVSGPAPGDKYYLARPRVPYAEQLRDAPPRELRVAVITASFWGRPAGPAVVAAVERVARVLEDLGHHVERDAPVFPAAALIDAAHVQWSLYLATVAGVLGPATGREAGPDTLEAASLACVRAGRELTAAEVERAAWTQNEVGRIWGAFLDRYDLLLCPTVPEPAPPAGSPDQDDPRYATARSWTDALFDRATFTPVFNTTGQPSLSLPLATGDDGAPIGVMLSAQSLREDLLLRVGAELERALPWADRLPPVSASSP